MSDDGTRIITCHPQHHAGQRWVGHITSDPPEEERRWAAGTVEHVIADMNKDLGSVPEAEYEIREGGAHGAGLAV